MVADGAISRTDKVISTAVSSWFGATTTARARLTPASFRTSERVAEPCTVTNPWVVACSSTSRSESMTTIEPGATPSASRAVTAERPLVP